MKTTHLHLIDEIVDMLQTSIQDVFSTALDLEVSPASIFDLRGDDEPLLAGSIGFTGEVNGMVYLYVKAPFARTLASRMLSLPEAEIDEESIVDDVIGELSNMIVGSVKSRLCDTGKACSQTIPVVVRGEHLRARSKTSDARYLSFECNRQHVLFEVLIQNPSTPDH
jgi:chemotaxis protein CheX